MKQDSILPKGLRFTQDGTVWINRDALQKQLLNQPSALLEQTRRYWGAALTPETIESVLRMAEFGYMRDLTDLLAESMKIDGHFGMVAAKRHRAVAAGRVNVVAASGDGIDPEMAKKCADLVRQQISWLRNWRQILTRLEWGHFHGRAAAEKVWDYDPDAEIKYRIADINWIHPRRLQFGPMRELRVRDDNFGNFGGSMASGQWPATFGSLGPGGFQAKGLDISALPLKFITFTPQIYNEYAEREGYGPRCLYYSFFKRFGKREQMVLLEIFGKPWRILEGEPAAGAAGIGVQVEQLKSAAEVIDSMGANATGYAPPGMRVKTEQPAAGAGQVHRDVISDSNDEISKIALGEARTMSTKPSGLGSTDSEEAADVNAEVKSEDSANLSDLLSEQLAVDIIILNFGPEAAIYAPRIEMLYEQAPDRDKETARVVTLTAAGVPLLASEVYDNIGYTLPGPDDQILVVKPPASAQLGGGGGFGDLPLAPGARPEPKALDAKAQQIAARSPLALQRIARLIAMAGEIEG